MKFPGFPDHEVELFNAVMNAVMREVIANNLNVTPEELAERFTQAALCGERNFARLKALTLGAEKAQAGLDWQLAN